MQSLRTSNSVGHTDTRVRNNQLFVFKIIHDLRHPTESLACGLAELAVELSSEYLKNDSNLVMTDQKRLKYSSHSRVKQALQRIKRAIQHSKSDFLSRHSYSHNSPISSFPIFTRSHNLKNVPDKDEIGGESSPCNSLISLQSQLLRHSVIEKNSERKQLFAKSSPSMKSARKHSPKQF